MNKPGSMRAHCCPWRSDVIVSAMPNMTLHFINARHQLSDMKDWLTEISRNVFAASVALLPLGDTDVVITRGKRVIPEKGHLGYAPEKGVIYVTVDPDHPSLQANPGQSFERMLAHEFHHCSRWDGPGYGRTLGEALISEGLAGRFAQEVFDGQPEPWETVEASVLWPHVPRARREWSNARYVHEEWFFGSAALPRWLGYSLGYQLVSRYLTAHPLESASALVHADSEIFLPHLGEI